jgi:UDP-MurNAc hydroxylase
VKIHFVGHASIIVESADTAILIDPWLFGKIFNNSWSLMPEPVLDQSMLSKVDYMWISHEHPDHCHFPTLDSFPIEFKKRVTILLQARDHEKLIAAFRKLGYENFKLLPHREQVSLPGSNTQVYCYHAGLMDSALAVSSEGQVVFDVNDARISRGECTIILKDLGRVDVLLNQFSLAAYSGFEPHGEFLKKRADQILQGVATAAAALQAKVTIPFASFIYFSTVDNKYINAFANTARGTYEYLQRKGKAAAVLYPGDVYEVGTLFDSTESLKKYDELPDLEHRSYDAIEHKPLTQVVAAYDEMAAQIRKRYPLSMLWMLSPVTIRIPDLDKTVRFRMASGTLEEVANTEQPDLMVNSQPLWFGFKFPFGIQTLGVSGRFSLLRNYTNWKFHRILFSLNNGGIYLRPSLFLTRDILGYCMTRLTGGLKQSIHYYRTSL